MQNSTGGQLLAAFYQNREPGLPVSLIDQLQQSESQLQVASGMLAAADRIRNSGKDPSSYSSALSKAEHSLRQALSLLPALQMAFPRARNGPPEHLIWHFLDKLSLELHISLDIRSPSDEASKPILNTIKMALVPDRDMVADSIRRTLTFHCPRIFREAFEKTVQDAPLSLITLVEVGGYLGDCLLWAAAWLGPSRLRALEVEPVASATARLSESIAINGLQDSMEVMTAALGDGEACELTASGVTNPNFVPQLCLKANEQSWGPGVNSAECYSQAPCTRLQTLSEVLDKWALLPSDSPSLDTGPC